MKPYNHWLMALALVIYIGYVACKVKKEVQRSHFLSDSLRTARRAVQLHRQQAGGVALQMKAIAAKARQQHWLHIDSITRIIETAPDNSRKISYRISGLQSGSESRTVHQRRQQATVVHQQEAIAVQVTHQDSISTTNKTISLQKKIKRPTALWLVFGLLAAAVFALGLWPRLRKLFSS